MGITTETKLHGGLICSGDQFITDRTQLDKIKGRYPDGLAVDMESGALAQVCYLYDVPFLSFRIISDTPGPTSISTSTKTFGAPWPTAHLA